MEEIILCGASSYEQKFYLNPEFSSLPEGIQNELQIMCVLYTEDIGGTLLVIYDEEGNLELRVSHEENDFAFDEIGSVLKIKELQRTKAEFFESLELYYKVFCLGRTFMLLTIDVGNTNITLGIFEAEELLGTFRMTTKHQRTSDEYGFTICGILEHRKIVAEQIDAVIIASVVPDIMHSLVNGILKYLEVRPLVVSAGIKTGIRIVTENPKEIGPDRIVDAVAGYELFGGPVIVVDFGTATTYDLIGPGGTFEAGITAPGIETAARSLWGGAAMLPAIEIKKPASILAKETISSMQAGLVYGAIGQTEYIVQKMKEESGYLDARVIATGGLGKIIAQATDSINEYKPNLTLDGLRLIYNKNKKS